ncbi:MAG: DNA repair protein RadC [Bacteroidetes bacterium]|nr:DNA repair protein RadC [Bacteroidota bacterium]
MAEHQIGHRERLRERFKKGGFTGFHDYEVLEMLLTFIFRQGDVKPLAKELIKTFGSFSKVLDASVADLENVKGMGKASALSLHAFRETMAYYFQNHAATDKEQITKMSALVEMLRASIGHKPNEVLLAIFLNAKNEVLATKELGEGTVSQASAFPRRIVEEALKHKATSIILAHNHPGGVAKPSEHDESITAEIQKALALLDISLQDHLILAGTEYFSFNRNGLL